MGEALPRCKQLAGGEARHLGGPSMGMVHKLAEWGGAQQPVPMKCPPAKSDVLKIPTSSTLGMWKWSSVGDDPLQEGWKTGVCVVNTSILHFSKWSDCDTLY